ncbi:hypothetical protein F4780DRAFT_51732 [Xylariomycetidae sp. FL0641]|nr:hypothetical protein F4780DRAFT_51732 [Xylariomycetidae sp. FL0641]
MTSPDPTSTLVKQWSSNLVAKSQVRAAFRDLATAVQSHNAEADKRKQDLSILIHQGTKLKDVQSVAEQLHNASQDSASKNNRERSLRDGLRKFCETSLYYSNIVDVIIQQHPEWASLAWGAIKFLLTVPVEYHRMKEAIVGTLGSLGEKFKAVHVFVDFFPNDRICEAASAVYASFAEFLHVSIRWLSANQFKRLLKSTFRPFDTSLKPILDKIDQSYASLKEQVEVSKVIRDYQAHQEQLQGLHSLRTSAGVTDQKLTRILIILEGIVKATTGFQQQPAQRTANLPDTNTKSSGNRKGGIRRLGIKQYLPALPAGHTYITDISPLDSDLERLQSLQALSPLASQYEGTGVLDRTDFRSWLMMEGSGLLWIDGYELHGRPSWLADFALRITHAVFLAGYEALYTFNCLCNGTGDTWTPIKLVQRFIQHLIQRHPDILDLGDPDFLSTEIFFAARTDLKLSCSILAECIQAAPPSVIYVIIEGIDGVQRAASSQSEYRTILDFFTKVSASGAGGKKTIKILLTSVAPDAGSDVSCGNQTHTLIRVSPAAARTRKQVSITKTTRRKRYLTGTHVAPEGLASSSERILTDADFVPEPETVVGTSDLDWILGRPQRRNSSRDFDIFEDAEPRSVGSERSALDCRELPRGKASGLIPSPPGRGSVGPRSQTDATDGLNMPSLSTRSSFDIFE